MRSRLEIICSTNLTTDCFGFWQLFPLDGTKLLDLASIGATNLQVLTSGVADVDFLAESNLCCAGMVTCSSNKKCDRAHRFIGRPGNSLSKEVDCRCKPGRSSM